MSGNDFTATEVAKYIRISEILNIKTLGIDCECFIDLLYCYFYHDFFLFNLRYNRSN